jgi:TolA-binding protein
MDTTQSLSASQPLVPGDVIEVRDEPPSDTADGEPAVAPSPTDAPASSTSTSRPAIVPYAESREIVVPDADTIVPPVEVSRLAEQNDLFSAAMAAEWRGQYAAALHKLDELIFRFPNGPLTESAHGERRRILSALR